MKLSIATNWQPDLVERLSPYPVKELFGSLPTTPVGGGRPAAFLPTVSREEIARHIAGAAGRGIEFNYLLNGFCLGSADAPAVAAGLSAHLEWIAGLGVTTVTVAHPHVLCAVKQQLPTLRVKMSILADLDTVGKVRTAADMGADEVALSIMQNRDFDFLETVAKVVSCDLTLLVNQVCLAMCAHRYHHGGINSHASRDDEEDTVYGVNYCLLKCAMEKLTRPSALVKSSWIRPEDLPVYEEIGYETFKIAGREMTTDWLVNAAGAYSARSYDGNLSDILNGIAVMPNDRRGAHKMPLIDNRKLDGFIDQFKRRRCNGHCVECTFCDTVAEEVIDLFPRENAGLIDTLRAMADTLL